MSEQWGNGTPMPQTQPQDHGPDSPVLGPFELLKLLGAGGMGRAYLARRLPLDGLGPEWEDAYGLGVPDDDEPSDAPRLVVVKVIQPDLLRHPDPAKEIEVRIRFSREIDAVRAVTGPRVPALVGAAARADKPWLAMEFVHGPSLGTLVAGRGPLATGPYGALGLALVEALRDIHAAGIYHRDLKPGNIVLGPQGPVVLDFGLAVLAERRTDQALTSSRAQLGTPPYMPLEQLKNPRDVDHTADVYALGASLFYAATGRAPYPVVPLNEPPSWVGVHEGFRPLLEVLVTQVRERRPSLDEVEDALHALLAEYGLTAEDAFAQLREFVETSGLAPELPAAARDEAAGDPRVREAAQRAVDEGAAPDRPWVAPDDGTDLFDMFDEEADQGSAPDQGPAPDHEPGPTGDGPAAPRPGHDGPTPTVVDPHAHPAPEPDPEREPEPSAPARPVTPAQAPTSYRLAPPRTGSSAPRRAAPGALRVAADLRKAYAHSVRLAPRA
jgi:serine/threonine protein kinase